MCLCAQVKAWGLMSFYWANRGTCGSVCSNVRGSIFEYDFRVPQRQMDKAKSPHVYGCLHRYASCSVCACVLSSGSFVPFFLSLFSLFLHFISPFLLSFTDLSPIFFLPSSSLFFHGLAFSSFFLLFLLPPSFYSLFSFLPYLLYHLFHHHVCYLSFILFLLLCLFSFQFYSSFTSSCSLPFQLMLLYLNGPCSY